MKAGKLSPNKLEGLVFNQLQKRRKDILLRPKLGEDSAVIDFGDEVCVIATDPITGAVERLGWLAVHVACNDIASNGAEPVGVQVALLLPEGSSDGFISELMADMDAACGELGIEILGGHTEITSEVKSPLVVATALGRAPRHRYITSHGARPGDKLYVTKGVGFEGTGILALDYAEQLKDFIDPQLLESAKEFLQEISIVKEALAAAGAGATAMHDITEGGFFGAVWEILSAASVGCRINLDAVPVLPETAAICDVLKLDPYRLISSGSLLIAAPNSVDLIESIDSVGVQAHYVGDVTADAGKMEIVLPCGKSKLLTEPKEDELWRFLKVK
ncbi:MAG: AIR synthase [Firmicutes bacterium]|nr:AIR synthase [Bacillota bacterium]